MLKMTYTYLATLPYALIRDLHVKAIKDGDRELYEMTLKCIRFKLYKK